jgi:hypothetical protein
MKIMTKDEIKITLQQIMKSNSAGFVVRYSADSSGISGIVPIIIKKEDLLFYDFMKDESGKETNILKIEFKKGDEFLLLNTLLFIDINPVYYTIEKQNNKKKLSERLKKELPKTELKDVNENEEKRLRIDEMGSEDDEYDDDIDKGIKKVIDHFKKNDENKEIEEVENENDEDNGIELDIDLESGDDEDDDDFKYMKDLDEAYLMRYCREIGLAYDELIWLTGWYIDNEDIDELQKQKFLKRLVDVLSRKSTLFITGLIQMITKEFKEFLKKR